MAELPIIDRASLKLALADLLNPEVETTREDFRDLRRILANRPSDELREEFDAAIRAKLAALPKFSVGDRVFSHYVMSWGTIVKVGHTSEATVHGVTGSPLPASTWYTVRMDKNGSNELLDDGGGNWDLARIVPPNIAKRYGYGDDPNPAGQLPAPRRT